MDSTVLLLLSTILLPLLIFLFLSKSTSGQRRRPLPPGPRGWPILGNLPQLGTKPHQTLAGLARTYGPLFHLRFGFVDVVVAASSSVARQFLKNHDANFSSRPPNSSGEHIAFNYRDLVFTPYGSHWRMLRKLCTVHLLSPKALDGFHNVREQEVSRLVNGLAGARGRTVQLGQELTVCLVNALSRAMMGRRVFDETRDAVEFKKMVLEIMEVGGVFNIGDFVPWVGWMDLQGVVGRMKRLHRSYNVFLDKIIAEHESKVGDEDRDLLSVMLRLKNKEDVDGEGGRITDTEIKALLLDLFNAGTDTSTSTMEWALAELIRHPNILRKVSQEIDSVVGQGRLVLDSDLPKLPFLHAVIKETFRLHPATPLMLPRISSENCEIEGYHIPKNTTLLVNVWAIGRDPTIWSDPLEFRPSRFLPGGDHAHVDVRGNDFELLPFGAGRRICAGAGLGVRMVQFITATLVHAFDWVLPEGQVPEKLDMEEAYGLTLQRAMPLMVRPVPRLLPDAYGPRC